MPYQRQRVPIGQRRERIAVQRAIRVDDALGGQAVTKWRTIAEPWASVLALDERDQEGLSAEQLTARHGYHITLPYSTDITPQTRLIWREKVLSIFTVADDESRRRRLVVYAGEVQ